MTYLQVSAVHSFVACALALTPAASASAQTDPPSGHSTSGPGAREKTSVENTPSGSSESDTSAESRETEQTTGAGEVRPKLSDRIKSVQRKHFLKKDRFELFPHFALDLNDPFFQHFIVGAALGFHLADSASVELRGGAVLASVKQGALRFVRRETDSLIKDPPEFKYHADIDFLWAPFYGKVSLFSEAILHFDTYVTAGPGIFGTDGGPNAAANVGIGQRYFVTDWLVARVELRNYVFLDTRNEESDIQNLLILGFSVSGFFPTTFEYEFQ